MRLAIFKEKSIQALVVFLFVALAIIFSYNRAFDAYELETLDLRYRIRPKQPQINHNIVIIQISDDSIEKIGSWPFDRKYHALLVKALSHGGAKEIIFDIFFSEKKEGDSELH